MKLARTRVRLFPLADLYIDFVNHFGFWENQRQWWRMCVSFSAGCGASTERIH
jgi:hypothetical protein